MADWKKEVKEAIRGQKHRCEAKKGMKELIYQKKHLTEVSQQPQKPLNSSFFLNWCNASPN